MPKLPKLLENKFTLVDWPGTGTRQIFGPKYRVVDLNKLTEAKALKLIRMGFPYLKQKPIKKEVPKEESSKEK